MFAHNENDSVRMFEMFLRASGWHQANQGNAEAFWHWNGREVYTYDQSQSGDMIGFSTQAHDEVVWERVDMVSVDMRSILLDLEQRRCPSTKGYREALHDALFEMYMERGMQQTGKQSEMAVTQMPAEQVIGLDDDVEEVVRCLTELGWADVEHQVADGGEWVRAFAPQTLQQFYVHFQNGKVHEVSFYDQTKDQYAYAVSISDIGSLWPLPHEWIDMFRAARDASDDRQSQRGVYGRNI